MAEEVFSAKKISENDEKLSIEKINNILLAIILSQIESRLHSLDLSLGAQIVWKEVAIELSKQCGRIYTPFETQFMWKKIAYDEDVAPPILPLTLLPDSDEDVSAINPEKKIKFNEAISRGLATRVHFRSILKTDTITNFAEESLGLLPSHDTIAFSSFASTPGVSSLRLDEALQLRDDRKKELERLLYAQPIIQTKSISKAMEIAGRIAKREPVIKLQQTLSSKKNVKEYLSNKKSSSKRMRLDESEIVIKEKPKEQENSILNQWISSLGLISPIEHEFSIAQQIIRKASKSSRSKKIKKG
jgi:hypothetical protein